MLGFIVIYSSHRSGCYNHIFFLHKTRLKIGLKSFFFFYLFFKQPFCGLSNKLQISWIEKIAKHFVHRLEMKKLVEHRQVLLVNELVKIALTKNVFLKSRIQVPAFFCLK